MQAVDYTPVLTSAVRNLWEKGTNWNHLRTIKMLPQSQGRIALQRSSIYILACSHPKSRGVNHSCRMGMGRNLPCRGQPRTAGQFSKGRKFSRGKWGSKDAWPHCCDSVLNPKIVQQRSGKTKIQNQDNEEVRNYLLNTQNKVTAP